MDENTRVNETTTTNNNSNNSDAALSIAPSSESDSVYETDIFFASESRHSSFSRNHTTNEDSASRDQSAEDVLDGITEHVVEEVDVNLQEEAVDEDNDEAQPEWRTKDKHLFILSEAGKPIYTLHGNEVHLITLMGLMQALVSIVECNQNDKLKYVIAGDHKIVFMHKDHLIFVCVSKEKNKCVEQLYAELNYIYSQIISVITLSLIKKIFRNHHNYDLRSKLTGTEKLLSNMVYRLKDDFGMLLSCVNCFPMAYESREQIAKIIINNISNMNDILFGLLLFDNRLVAIVRPKKKQLHPADIHLLINVITGLDTPKSSEFTCYPICLPNYDSNGIMYANISHLDKNCRACLILLTIFLDDHEKTLKLNDCQKRIRDKILSNGLLETPAPSPIINSDLSALEQIDVSELKHFLYKDRKLFQYFVTDYALPYSVSSEEKQRLFDIYQNLYHKLHNSTNLLKIIYYRHNYETVLGWLTTEFEIYATFSPLITKNDMLNATNRILDFIKKNRPKIFITSMPTLP